MEPRPWMTLPSIERERAILDAVAALSTDALDERLHDLVDTHVRTYERDCINLDPAANVMNPRAEALLSAGLGSRPSLGYPGAKYEAGLEAMEEIEVIAADLATRVFGAVYAEVRVPSGAIANLYAFMATCRPGDAIIVPPAAIGGHVTHHRAGAAGLYGLEVHPAPVDADRFTVDVEALGALAQRVRPALITIGGSLNLEPHPIAAIRAVADDVGAAVLFDAAHVCGLIAGGIWPNPLADGAHLVTMSTYKSLGGPPAGLVLTDDRVLAQRIDAIAHPGLTANFDGGATAALAVTLLDWLDVGADYASAMVANAAGLAEALTANGVPVYRGARGATATHQLAIDARTFGGGGALARRLRAANLLASGIGLPLARVGLAPGEVAGVRLGTPEVTRIGMGRREMAELARLVARATTHDPASVAPLVSELRARFPRVRFVRIPRDRRTR